MRISLIFFTTLWYGLSSISQTVACEGCPDSQSEHEKRGLEVMEPLILYFHPKSSCSWRIKLALDYKGIPYEIIETNVAEASEDYRKINPMKKVPSITVNGKTFSQSVAILEYLEETLPEYPHLLPGNPDERALVRQIVQAVASDIQPLQNGGVLRELEDGTAWAQFWIQRGFVGLEEMLSNSAGIYSVGNEITMADIFLLPQIRNAHKYGVDLAPFPTLRMVEKNLEDVKKLHVPSHSGSSSQSRS